MTGHAAAASPRSLGEIVALVNGTDRRISYIAGGTDLIIELEKVPLPDLIIDLTQIRDLDFVRALGDTFHIGAATTLSTLARHPAIAGDLQMLAQAATQVGSVQIRNRATIGGNIASAVPAGDLLPVLKCLDSRIKVLRQDGRTETLAFDDVVLGRGKTTLGNADLITEVIIPLRFGKNRLSAFGKIGLREVLAIARLNMAVLVDFDRQANRVNDIRIVAGAIGPVPLRLLAVEAVFKNRDVNQVLADDVLNALSDTVDSAISGRHSRPYKRQAIVGLGLDLLQRLFGREFEAPALQADHV